MKKTPKPFPNYILFLCSQNYALADSTTKIPRELYAVKRPKKLCC